MEFDLNDFFQFNDKFGLTNLIGTKQVFNPPELKGEAEVIGEMSPFEKSVYSRLHYIAQSMEFIWFRVAQNRNVKCYTDIYGNLTVKYGQYVDLHAQIKFSFSVRFPHLLHRYNDLTFGNGYTAALLSDSNKRADALFHKKMMGAKLGYLAAQHQAKNAQILQIAFDFFQNFNLTHDM